ncbi:hypothetical protein ACTXGQ_18115 [Marinobacter sp. 1Y8]
MLLSVQTAFFGWCHEKTLALDLLIWEVMSELAQTEKGKRWVLDNFGCWHRFSPENPGTRPLAEGSMRVLMSYSQGVMTSRVV